MGDNLASELKTSRDQRPVCQAEQDEAKDKIEEEEI
jgi:hypothetical protein